MRLTSLLTLMFTLMLLGGCGAHLCEEEPGTISPQLLDAGVVLQGYQACRFGSASEAAQLTHVAHSKLYHPGLGEYWEAAQAYMQHWEDQGWERTACFDGLGQTTHDDVEVTQCYVKGLQLVRLHAYEFNGAVVDLDLLQR